MFQEDGRTGCSFFLKFRAEILEVSGGLVSVESVFSTDQRDPTWTLSPFFIFLFILNYFPRLPLRVGSG